MFCSHVDQILAVFCSSGLINSILSHLLECGLLLVSENSNFNTGSFNVGKQALVFFCDQLTLVSTAASLMAS